VQLSRITIGRLIVVLTACGVFFVLPSDERAQSQAGLTPERARAALVELIRRNPEFFEMKLSPRELDELAKATIEKRTEEPRGTEYFCGGFLIDPERATYTLDLMGGPATCMVHYQGDFESSSGRWIALKPGATYFLPRR
jgi:hypothetical protein